MQTSKIYSGPMTRSRLMLTKNYVAAPRFLDGVEWKQTSRGMKLHEKGTQDVAFMTVVGEISAEKLAVGTSGNFNKTYQSSPVKSKFQFFLVTPNDKDFRPDFTAAVKTMEECQRRTAKGPEMRNFVLNEGSERSLRFTAPMMELRDRPLYIEDNLDDVTRAWDVASEHREAFESVRLTHEVTPLLVFDNDDNEVAFHTLQSRLPGALVEVYFSLTYNYIGANKLNSYMATIGQVIILRDALPEPENPFRRKAGQRRVPWRPSRSEQVAAAKAFVPDPRNNAVGRINAAIPKAIPFQDASNKHQNSNTISQGQSTFYHSAGGKDSTLKELQASTVTEFSYVGAAHEMPTESQQVTVPAPEPSLLIRLKRPREDPDDHEDSEDPELADDKFTPANDENDEPQSEEEESGPVKPPKRSRRKY